MVTCLKLNLLRPIIITYSTKLKLLSLKLKIPRLSEFVSHYLLTHSRPSHVSVDAFPWHILLLSNLSIVWRMALSFCLPFEDPFSLLWTICCCCCCCCCCCVASVVKCHQFQVLLQEPWLIDCNVPTVLPYDLEHPYRAFLSLPRSHLECPGRV